MEEPEGPGAIRAEEEETQRAIVIGSRENRFTLKGCRGQGGRVVEADFSSK